jgi:hypothetical protein
MGGRAWHVAAGASALKLCRACELTGGASRGTIASLDQFASKYLHFVTGLLRWAVKKGYLTRNPIADVDTLRHASEAASRRCHSRAAPATVDRRRAGNMLPARRAVGADMGRRRPDEARAAGARGEVEESPTADPADLGRLAGDRPAFQ